MAAPRTVYMFTEDTSYGGALGVALSLIDGLDRDRFRPTLVCNDSEMLAPIAREREIELWSVPAMPEGASGAARAARFAAALRTRHPDIFHAHLSWPLSCKFALAAAVLARVPAVVATEHLFVEFPVTRGARLQQRALCRAVGRYLAVSEYVKRRVVEAFGWPESRIEVVHNGIEAAAWQSDPDPSMRAALSRGETRAVVLATARLVPEKGLATLLAAARELRDVQVVIAGDGPEREALAARAAELGIADRVELLGHRDDVPQLLACADVVVLPSLNEGLPLAVLEAMAAGKPVVATAVGGTGEAVIDRQTGLLVPAGDAAALGAAIGELLGDPRLAATLSAAARARVEESFTRERMLAEVTAVYGELLTRGRRT